MIARYGLWDAQGTELEAFLGKALASYGGLLEQLHGEDVFHQHPVLSYEALVANPEAVLPSLAARLGLPPWDTWGPPLLPRIARGPEGSMKTDSAQASEAPETLLAQMEMLQERILLEH